MIKAVLTVALAMATTPAAAQAEDPPARPTPNAACATGTHYATIRHNRIRPGKWRLFEEAIALHNAWYVVQGNRTETTLVRVIRPAGSGYVTASDEAVTITRYEDTAKPPRDDARAAFVAKYNESSVMTDEMRVCLPDK